ncbi:hypothetical protein HPB47_018038 [Ixodes persulcatus]|uniref:Uncharacterized protein n=1 Tax=Ixodes persulcatus TaxID=34615 RepID=A0AC60QLS5_IXOPE|nr:hypothetical protein HPB47_018038 [Ixodes persulcatus]
MNLFGFAMLRSMAVVYVGVLQEFHVTRGQAAWPLSLTGVFYTFTAPAVGVLARHISIWKLTLVGSVASSICVSLCYFANGIPYLIVCYGISQGISIAFISLTHTVINQNFSNHKAVASGISGAGFTIGGLVFPPMPVLYYNEVHGRCLFLLVTGKHRMNLIKPRHCKETPLKIAVRALRKNSLQDLCRNLQRRPAKTR